MNWTLRQRSLAPPLGITPCRERGHIPPIGLDNILHADDEAGAQAISRLRAESRVPVDVSLVEGGTLGLELLSYVWDCHD